MDRTWALGEVSVTPPATQVAVEDWSSVKAQLTERLRQTVLAEAGLGRRVDDPRAAELIVDVSVKLRETRAPNSWEALGLFSAVGLELAGIAIDDARPDREAPVALPLGLATGLLVAGAGHLFLPTQDITGSMDATLTFRRAADGASILQRHVRSEYAVQRRGLNLQHSLDTLLAGATCDLELQLVSALRDGLADAPGQKLALVPGEETR